jgi:hypothetical protein
LKRYAVTAQVTISIHTYVKAETPEEAYNIAEARPMVGLCYQCGGDGSVNEEWCTSGELDGSPDKMRVEEEEA